MAWHPIAHTLPQYVDGNGDPHSGAVLKAYANGTSSNISMATDATGGTTATSMALNASGYPEVSGNEIIPHVQESYKLSLYPTQAAADLDSGALWTIDELTVGPTYDEDYVVDTGAADAIVITPSPPIPAYAAGQKFAIKIIATNTGAATVNVNGLGAAAIKKDVSSALTAGDLTIGEIAVIQYDGTNFQLLSTKFGADLNGAKLILDADGDTSITADTDDTIDIEVGGSDVVQITGTAFDLNGLELILDADGDTSLHADTDDQIDIKTGGTDRVVITNGVQVGVPTGGDQGAGSINVEALYVNGALFSPTSSTLVLLSTVTPAAAADVTFTTAAWFTTTYAALVVEIDGVYPSAAGASLWMRLSDDGGSTWLAGTNYVVLTHGLTTTGATPNDVYANHDRIGIAGDVDGTASSGGCSATVQLTGMPASAKTMARADVVWAKNTGIIGGNNVWAYLQSTVATDGIQVLFSSGNITGTVRLYGIVA